MNKVLSCFRVSALVLALGAFPVFALAEEGSAADSVTVVSVTEEAPAASSDEMYARKRAEIEATAARRAAQASSTEQKRIEVRTRIEEKREIKEERRAERTSTTSAKALSEEEREALKVARENSKERAKVVREMMKDRLEDLREASTTPAHSREELRQIIEERRQAYLNDVASSSPEVRRVLEGVAPMRVAVHALLASRELFGGGGIGDQVSDIARQMNDSVASTTDAIVEIESRGALKKILLGGDKKSSQAISQHVAKNQERMVVLTGLLSGASTTPEIRAEIETQIQAVQAEQARLQAIAESQTRLWGIFSWRLF